MDNLSTSVRNRITKYLPATRQPRLAILNSCSKTGDAGESWLIATESHLLVGSQDLTGEMEFQAYPLKEITGIEREGHGFGRGRLTFLSGSRVVDRLEYSALDSDKFEKTDQEILALVRKAGGRPAPPSPLPEPEAGVPPKTSTPPRKGTEPPVGPQIAIGSTGPARAGGKKPAPPQLSREGPEPPQTEESRPPRAGTPKPAGREAPGVARKTTLSPAGRPRTAPIDRSARTVAIPKTPPRSLPRQTVAAVPRPKREPSAARPRSTEQKTPAPGEKKEVSLRRIGGRGSSAIVILMPSSTIAAGELVPVHVGHRQARDAACRGFRLHFRGMEETRITHGMGNNRRTSRERRIIIDEEHVLFGAKSQDGAENFGDALGSFFSAGKYPVLRAGNHVWETNLFLPKASAPSYEGSHGSIRYSLKAYADIPRGFDIMKIAPVLVLPDEEHRTLQFAPVQSAVRMADPRDIRLHVEMDGYRWGREPKITGRVRFTNPKRREVRALKVEAFYEEFAVADSETRHTKVAAKHSSSRLGFTGTEFPTRGFSVPAPPAIPVFTGTNLQVELRVIVSLDLPWETDAKVEFLAVPGEPPG